MRALLIYCHPNPESFSASVRDTIVDTLRGAGSEIRVLDLYGMAFDPVLSPGELSGYYEMPGNQIPVAEHCDALAWCDTLFLVYPTWWSGLPAMLKGWLDRVMLPGVAFHPPGAGQTAIRPGLINIERIGVFTTCGSSRWLNVLSGQPGRRTIMRGLRALCAKKCRAFFCALYLAESITDQARRAHLARVAAMTRKTTAS